MFSDSLAERLDNLPSEDPERRIVIVELQKDTSCGIGLTIVGGENMGKMDLGIFIKSITPGGPAEQDGRVHPGDRIIAINGQSLEGIPHHVAVKIIRESPPVVQLVISQTKLPLPQNLYERDSSPSLDEATVEGLIATGRMLEEQSHHPHRSVEGQEMRHDLTHGSHFRPASPANSSDLELENVIPPEALKPDYIQQHMSPTNFTPVGLRSSVGPADGRRSRSPAGEGRSQTPSTSGRRSAQRKDMHNHGM